MVVDELAQRCRANLKSHKARAVAAQVRLGAGPGGIPGPAAVIAVPNSYTNESGGPVSALLRFFSVPVERLVVVHEELDIDAGSVWLKRGVGEGGHNGLGRSAPRSALRTTTACGSASGAPPGRWDAANFVPRDFSPMERKELPSVLDDAADAVEALVTLGLLEAQQRVHAPQ